MNAPRILLMAALPLVLSCPRTDPPVLPPGPGDPAANLAQYDAFAHRVQMEALHAAWLSATEPEANSRPAPFGMLPLLLLRDDEVRALAMRLDNREQSQCLQAVHSFAVHMQVQSDPAVQDAMSEIGALRHEMPDLSTVFTDDEDLARRERLWSSQAQIAGRLAPLVRRVIAARTQWASRRASGGYLTLMKGHRGYEPHVVDQLERQVRETLAARADATIRPWEFELIDPRLAQRMAKKFDSARCLERASIVLRQLGLPAAPSALRVSTANRASFSPFASYAVDPPGDHRVTVRPGAGIAPHWSTFHELGHAATSLLAARSSCRTMRRAISPAVSESCAKIAERLFFSPEWLRTQHVPAGDVDALQTWETQSELMRMRSILADIELERVLYENPRAEVMADYVAIQARTARVAVSRDFPAWALKRHLAFEPLGRVDYLLARCAQAAVYRRLRRLPGGLLGPAARDVLREDVYRGASAMRYEEWFRRATGDEPNCTAWLEDVGGR